MNEKDIEKVVMLDTIQAQACHVISSEALRMCPYHKLVSKAKDTIQAEINADVAREIGLVSNDWHECPANKR